MDTLVNVNFADVRGKRLLVALSGGADSTALLRLLADRRDSDALFIAAAHFNHCIRGEDADADEAFCRALCAELNVPFFCERADVPAIAAERRLGFETCARELRYAFLRRVCARERMDRIALAHHADDQAETVLMHLLRGAGPEGICGMPRFSGDLYRPLLNARHRDLIAYLRSIGAKWREDATNALPDSPRNALRLNVLPEIEKNYPTAVRAICRYAESAQIESDHLARQTEDFLRSRLSRGAYGQRLTIREGDEEAILRRAMRQICGSRLNAEKLGELIALTRETRGRISVFSDLDAERVPDALYFLPKPAKKPAAVPLAVPGETCLTGVCRIEAENGDFAIMRGDPSIEVVDADAMPNAVLRTWTQGDRMRALGAPGSRLLSDCMIDRHIDRPLRAYLPVIADGKNVLWAQGIGIAEEIRIQPATRRRLRLQIKTYETDDVEATMKNDISKILLTEEELQQRVKELGEEIARDYAGKNPTMVCILKGAVMFYTDLLRSMPIPLTMDFMAVSSYGNKSKSSGEVEIRKDLSTSIENKHVIIVEDIVDSGFTLSYLKRALASRGAASIALATLLDKPARRAPGITLKSDYSGFVIGDEFVVGYGLDFAEKYRNLPYIGVLKPSVYEK